MRWRGLGDAEGTGADRSSVSASSAASHESSCHRRAKPGRSPSGEEPGLLPRASAFGPSSLPQLPYELQPSGSTALLQLACGQPFGLKMATCITPGSSLPKNSPESHRRANSEPSTFKSRRAASSKISHCSSSEINSKLTPAIALLPKLVSASVTNHIDTWSPTEDGESRLCADL